MLKYTMMKMIDKHTALKRISALVFAAMLLLGMAAAAEVDPLKPADRIYEDGNIELHKQAERIGPDEWKVDVSATIKNKPVEPQQMEVVFVLDASATMRNCTEMELHNAGSHYHDSYTCNLICNQDHTVHVNSCWDCGRIEGNHYSNKECEYTDENGNTVMYSPTRFEVAKAAIKKLAASLPTGSIKGKIAFNIKGYPEKAHEYANGYDKVIPMGETYMMEGIETGLKCFGDGNAKKILIIVTDGASSDGYYSAKFENFAADPNHVVYTVGFNHVDNNLAGLARNGGFYTTAANAGDLEHAFDEIQRKIMIMITDPMGSTVNFVRNSIVDDESQVDGSVTYSGNTLYWNPNDGSAIANK